MMTKPKIKISSFLITLTLSVTCGQGWHVITYHIFYQIKQIYLMGLDFPIYGSDLAICQGSGGKAKQRTTLLLPYKPSTKQLLSRDKEERQPGTDQMNQRKMFRHVTGNKPLERNSAQLSKERNLNKYECISKEDTRNRLSMGSRHKQVG